MLFDFEAGLIQPGMPKMIRLITSPSQSLYNKVATAAMVQATALSTVAPMSLCQTTVTACRCSGRPKVRGKIPLPRSLVKSNSYANNFRSMTIAIDIKITPQNK